MVIMAENEGEMHNNCSRINNNGSSSSCSSSSSSASSSNPCPICHGPVIQDAYLDQCFHKFCYNCILRWAKTVASRHSRPPSALNCPMCKTENSSIIYEYDGISFQRHYVDQDLANSFCFSKAHKSRLKCYYVEPGALGDAFKVSLYWKSLKFLQPNNWLHDWLRRELQALILEEDVEIIVHHILGIIDSFRRNGQKSYGGRPELKQEEFKLLVSEATKPFLVGRADRFANELELFLASGLNIQAYDELYIRQLGWKMPNITEEEEGEFHDHTPIIPYLYFFDDDSDGNE